jgi:L-aspartate oxidase
LLSEALRGEGAVLRNSDLHRFMPKYNDAAEMAPRDVVALAIAHELEVCPLKDPVVYLDMTHLNADHIRARFPRIYETCLKYNVDIAIDLVPIRPAAHYLMGGIRTDLQARSSLPGLYAAGEAACTGVHGANRLASNSLLEGLVFGARAGEAMRNELKDARVVNAVNQAEAVEQSKAQSKDQPTASGAPDNAAGDTENFIQGVQQMMWNKVGIVRSRQGLTEAMEYLQSAGGQLPEPISRRNCEAGNVHTAAQLITRSALARLESRGAHYRTDYPEHDDARFRKHSVVGAKGIQFV